MSPEARSGTPTCPHRTGLETKCFSNPALRSPAAQGHHFLTWTKPLGASHNNLVSESKEKARTRSFPPDTSNTFVLTTREDTDVAFRRYIVQTPAASFNDGFTASIMLSLLNLHSRNFHINVACLAYTCTSEGHLHIKLTDFSPVSYKLIDIK